MAYLAESDIMVGQRSVGLVRVDPGSLRAVGGPLEPRLVIPVTIELPSRPLDEMLALVSLEATLHLGESSNPASRLSLSARADMITHMPCRSVGGRTSVDLHFPLTPASVARLERERHDAPADAFFLWLAPKGLVAWLSTRGETGAENDPAPFGTMFGLHSQLSYFWSTTISDLRVGVEPSVWVRNVLPGLGFDRVRLIEVTLPPALPKIGNSAKEWDGAVRAFDERRYEDCVGKCRGLINAWNRQLNTNRKVHLADVVAERCGWAAGDPRRGLLDALWQGLLDASNAPLHPEGQDHSRTLTPADARLHLLLTAVLSEYVSEVLPAGSA